MTIHHCISMNPDHGVYRAMSEPVRAASTFLSDPSVAADEIDVSPSLLTALTVESDYHLRTHVETRLYLPTFGYGSSASRCH